MAKKELNPAGEKVQALLSLTKKLEALQHEIIEYHYELDKTLQGQVLHPMQDLVDLGFLHREMSYQLDAMRKESNARMDKISRIIGAIVARKIAGDPTLDMRQHGTLASGTPSPSVIAFCPKPGSVEYATLLRGFGVNEDAIKAGVLAPHFVRTAEYVSDLVSRGLPAPAGILGTAPSFSVTYVKKRQNG